LMSEDCVSWRASCSSWTFEDTDGGTINHNEKQFIWVFSRCVKKLCSTRHVRVWYLAQGFVFLRYNTLHLEVGVAIFILSQKRTQSLIQVHAHDYIQHRVNLRWTLQYHSKHGRGRYRGSYLSCHNDLFEMSSIFSSDDWSALFSHQ
jgi:hypothetical protein